jgi:hypothetical protein
VAKMTCKYVKRWKRPELVWSKYNSTKMSKIVGVKELLDLSSKRKIEV